MKKILTNILRLIYLTPFLYLLLNYSIFSIKPTVPQSIKSHYDSNLVLIKDIYYPNQDKINIKYEISGIYYLSWIDTLLSKLTISLNEYLYNLDNENRLFSLLNTVSQSKKYILSGDKNYFQRNIKIDDLSTKEVEDLIKQKKYFPKIIIGHSNQDDIEQLTGLFSFQDKCIVSEKQVIYDFIFFHELAHYINLSLEKGNLTTDEIFNSLNPENQNKEMKSLINIYATTIYQENVADILAVMFLKQRYKDLNVVESLKSLSESRIKKITNNISELNKHNQDNYLSSFALANAAIIYDDLAKNISEKELLKMENIYPLALISTDIGVKNLLEIIDNYMKKDNNLNVSLTSVINYYNDIINSENENYIINMNRLFLNKKLEFNNSKKLNELLNIEPRKF